MILVTLVATGVSWAVVFGRGGSFPEVTPPTSGALSSGPSNSTLSSLSSAVGGISGLLFNSTATTVSVTFALGGHVDVSASSLPAADFTVNGSTSSFTCSTSPSGAYLALEDDGAGTVSVTSVALGSVGNETVFTASGPCAVSSSSTTFVTFSASSHMAPSPLSGGFYAGVIGFSDDSQTPFDGMWQ
jgi:hypothetical protein